MLGVRPIQHETIIDEATGTMVVRRDYEDVTPCSPAMQLAHPSNMAIYTAADVSRYCQQHRIWQQSGGKGPEPTIPKAEEAAQLFSKYAAKYSWKLPEDQLPGLTAIAAKACKAASDATDRHATAAEAGRALIVKLQNAVNGALLLPATEAAYHLLYDPLVTYDTVYFPHKLFMHLLLPTTAPDDHTADVTVELVAEEDFCGFISAATDYHARPPELSMLCPYLFYMLVEKRRNTDTMPQTINRYSVHVMHMFMSCKSP